MRDVFANFDKLCHDFATTLAKLKLDSLCLISYIYNIIIYFFYIDIRDVRERHSDHDQCLCHSLSVVPENRGKVAKLKFISFIISPIRKATDYINFSTLPRPGKVFAMAGNLAQLNQPPRGDTESEQV